MEGKTVILSVFIMSLVMAQIQVGAKSCCPSKIARGIYNACRAEGGSIKTCASLSGCKIIEDGTECPHIYNGTVSSPPIYDHGILEKSVLTQGDAVNEYCKLGCASSVCGAITTLQNSDSSEIVNRAVEQCTKACSTFCTKGSMTAVETA